ncbi:Immunoglobulin I-set domain protein [Sedimentisphaera salicampi]|uniref:Immunoglobulin I-set domain protein n=2 Tax=Sedimentisphaera salicampi TaxID=1941349 RepID=A0A1W6LPV8_9BACT|nr:Immunoglobulin I-set domain protein [Sedimentisphaera salicampi]
MLKKMKSLIFLCSVLAAAGVWAGDIVPGFDDADALCDYTAARDGQTSDPVNIDPGSQITFAARFTPAAIDVSDPANPVVVLEVGGTTFGSGFYICNGTLVYALKTGAGGTPQTGLEDLDLGDSAASVILGELQAEEQVEVFLSLDLSTGKVAYSINGDYAVKKFINHPGQTNLTGNNSVAFLGAGGLNSGHMGGLTGGDNGQMDLLNADHIFSMQGVEGADIRGQIFNDVFDDSYIPHDPNPASGAVNVDPSSTTSLSFYTAEDLANPGAQNPDVTAHFVTFYEGADGEPNMDQIISEDTIAAGADPISFPYSFQRGDEVFWQIEEQINGAAKGSEENIKGPVWSFKALKTIPSFLDQPEDQLVFEDEDAEFVCGINSGEPISTLNWYKVGEPDVVVDDSDPDITITTVQDGEDYTSTLTITNLEMADEGQYYCQAENINGTNTSDSASLKLKRLVAHYQFDGDYTDSASGYDITPYDTELTGQWTEGVIGQALNLKDFADENATPTSSGGNTADLLYPGEGTGMMTLSAWIQWSGPNPAGGFWSHWFGNDGAGGFNFAIQANRGGGRLHINSPNGVMDPLFDNFLPGSIENLIQDEWVLVTATANTVSGKLYMNGQLVLEDSGFSIATNETNIYVGCEGSSTNKPAYGYIDDARVYNYILSDDEVAQLYYDVTGESVCSDFNAENLQYDFDGDCQVSLSDLQTAAGGWLNSKLYPSDGSL